MQDKNAYLKALSARHQEWLWQIEDIKSKAKRVAAMQQLEFYRQLDLLDAKIHLMQEKLQLLEAAEGAAWNELKASLDGIGNEIENALDSAGAKVR
ncbi:MAG: hypothetical protein ACE5HS_11680 [bacterium]